MKQHKCKAHKNKLGVVWCSKCGKLFGKPWLFVLILLFSSCVSYQRCFDKFGGERQDTVITYIDRVIPADVIFDTIQVSKLQIDTVYQVTQGRATVRYEVRDSLIYIEALCDTIFVKDTIYQEVMINDFKPPENTIKDSIQWGVWLVIALIVLVILVKFGFRR